MEVKVPRLSSLSFFVDHVDDYDRHEDKNAAYTANNNTKNISYEK